jgi:hypothetical protein
MNMINPLQVASVISVVLILLFCPESEACKLIGCRKNCGDGSIRIPSWASYIDGPSRDIYSGECNCAPGSGKCYCCQSGGGSAIVGPGVQCDKNSCVLVPPGGSPPLCAKMRACPQSYLTSTLDQTSKLNSCNANRSYAMVCDSCTHEYRFALPREVRKAFCGNPYNVLFGNPDYWIGRGC